MADENEPTTTEEVQLETAPETPVAETGPSDAAPTSDAAPATDKAPAEAKAEQPVDDGSPKKKKRPGTSPRIGKKLRNQLKSQSQKVRKFQAVPLAEAIATLKKMKRAKFDETVEVHVNTGIDATQSDQLVRGSVSLPHGIGKTLRVVAFCQGDNIEKAKAAGADEAGADDLLAKIQEGWLDFDVAIATQDMMGKVSRLGKVLGPRGLMPTPKAGTVVPANIDVGGVVADFKAGKVEYRVDKTGQIHAGVGKLSFSDDKLVDNIKTFVETVRNAKPPTMKGNYINGIVISATMSPGVPATV